LTQICCQCFLQPTWYWILWMKDTAEKHTHCAGTQYSTWNKHKFSFSPKSGERKMKDLGNVEFLPILLLWPSIITLLHISHGSFYFFKMHMFYITLFPPLKSPYRAFMWSIAQHFMLLLRMECSCCNFNKGIVFLFFFFAEPWD